MPKQSFCGHKTYDFALDFDDNNYIRRYHVDERGNAVVREIYELPHSNVHAIRQHALPGSIAKDLPTRKHICADHSGIYIQYFAGRMLFLDHETRLSYLLLILCQWDGGCPTRHIHAAYFGATAISKVALVHSTG